MRCYKCYYNNPKGANFCARCGIPLVRIEEGERRRASLMFADISRFSELAKSLDPEILRDTIDNAFAELIEIIHKYEGIVDKIIGDCIMAVFGVPKSYEDTPLRSVMAAIEIREKFKEIAGKNKELSSASISIGVNYGLVVTGAPGKASAYTVMGDAVVLAERLQSFAPPGKIYVSETIYRNTNEEIEYQTIGKVRVKGGREVTAYMPLHIKAQAPIRRLKEIPMIGRKKEIATLLKAAESIIEGKGELISVVGEPGIGKSKLLFEFKKEVSRRYGDQFLLLERRGLPHSKKSSYAVLREVINEIMQVKGMESFTPTESTPYIKYFLSKELAYKEREKIESMNPHDRKEAIEKSLLKIIYYLSRKRPLIFILDDAQWIDDESLKFILKIREENPVFSIISYRPMEGVEEVVDKISHPKIILKGLMDKEILYLAKVKLDCEKLDTGLSGFLLCKSGGNPFYIEELINSLLEQQKITLQKEIAVCKGEIEKAITYSEKGGDHKRKLCLNEEAIEAYTGCVNLILKSYKGRDKLLGLYEKLGEIYESLGEYANGIRSYREGIHYARESNDKARMLRKNARIFLQKGDYEKAYRILREAGELVKTGSNEWGWIRIHQAQLETLTSNFSQAERITGEVLNKTDLLAESLKVRAVVCDYQGKRKEALLHRERALKIVKKSGDEQKLRSGFELLDKLYSDYRCEQRKWLELSFDLWEGYIGKPRVAKNELELGEFYHSQKNFQKAIAHYQKSLEIWREVENKAGICTALYFLGKTYQEAKMPEKALDSYNECLRVLNEMGRKINLPEVQSAISAIHELPLH